MDIIHSRLTKLRDELENIKSNRERLNYLKDYYTGRPQWFCNWSGIS